MASIKLDPKITQALSDLVTSIASVAADAALGEVQDRIRDGVSKVDLGISKTRSRVRSKGKRGAHVEQDPDVIDAEFVETKRH